MQNYKTLSVNTRKPGVGQITMDRQDVFNAFNETMIEELGRAIDTLVADEQVRIIVLAGAGKHFSAGADLQWMQRASEASVEWNLEDARKFAGMLNRIDHCPKPTVARVQGAALGGGTGLVCTCDIAVATETASFAVSEAKFGIIPSVIGPYVINAVGKRHARRLALSTSRIRATEAHSIGLVHHVSADEEIDSTLDNFLEDLLTAGPNAQKEIKALFGQLSAGPVEADTIELTAQTISRIRGTDEAREGFAAFMEKRPANWIPESC